MDAARYPVAAKVAELLTRGHVLFLATFHCNMFIIHFLLGQLHVKFTVNLLEHYFMLILQHYNVELKDNSVELTEEGIALSEMALETNDLWDENDPWAR